jgi:hypothetical protein
VRCGHQIGRARSGPGSSCSPGLQPGEDALRCSALTGPGRRPARHSTPTRWSADMTSARTLELPEKPA